MPFHSQHEMPAPGPRRGASLAWLVAIIAVVAAGAWTFRATLIGTAATGSLRIESQPAGAVVDIDGTARGLTPITVELAPGSHTVEVTHDEDTQEIAATVTAGSTATHHFRWAAPATAAAPARGRLSVSSEPAGGTVTVDGVARGASPLTIDDLEPGDHQVVVQVLGRTHNRTVNIDAGSTTSLVVTNAPAPARAADVGWLSARTSIQLQVFERGRRLGTTEERIVLSPGNHELEFTADEFGFRTRRTVTITAGQTTMAAMSLPQAGVNLNAVPWADVTIDGKDVGQTPIANLMLPIGPHQVTFRHPQLGEKQTTVTVSLQEPARVAVDMRGR